MAPPHWTSACAVSLSCHHMGILCRDAQKGMLGTERHTAIKSTEQRLFGWYSQVWCSPGVCCDDCSKAGVLSLSCSSVGVAGPPLLSSSAALL